MKDDFKKGGTLALIKIAFRNIGRNKRRTAFCLCAVAIAVFFIPIFASLIDGMTTNINDVVQIYETGQVLAVSRQFEAEKEYLPVQYPVANGRNWREVASEIEAIPGVSFVLPRISTMATLQEGTVKHAVLWGLDLARETGPNAVFNLNLGERNDGLVSGRWPADANECAVGVSFSRKSGLTIGDTVPLKTISAQFSDKYWSPEIVGIFSLEYPKIDSSYIVVDHDRLQRLLVLDEGTQSLFIFADDENLSPGITARVQNLLGSDHTVSDWQENYWVAMMKSVTPIYYVIYLVFLIVASFLIINTVVMIVQERIKEIGMMGSLGMTRGEIVNVFFFESVILAVIGSLIGIILGGVVIGLLQNFPFKIFDLYGESFMEMPISNTIFYEFSIGRLIESFIMGVVVASLFTLIPSLRSAKVEPVEALRR